MSDKVYQAKHSLQKNREALEADLREFAAACQPVILGVADELQIDGRYQPALLEEVARRAAELASRLHQLETKRSCIKHFADE